jgi:hypothetical protein
MPLRNLHHASRRNRWSNHYNIIKLINEAEEKDSKQDESNDESIHKWKEKSEDDFEKNITYISAGALGLSLTFSEKLINLNTSNYREELIFSWIYLVATLLLNLGSHMIASYYADKCLDDLLDRPKVYNNNLKRRNFVLRSLNFLTLIIMICGLLLLVSYTAKNTLYNITTVK